jgi:CBS domain-containing protein
VDPLDFLRRYPPFESLEPGRLEAIAADVVIEFFPVGASILQQGGEPARFLYAVRKGAVELMDQDRVLDLLVEGEVFGHPSLLSGLSPTFSVRAHEDTLCYLIAEDPARELLGTATGLAFLSASLRRRVIRAVEGGEGERGDPRNVTVGSLIRRPPVTCSASTSVRKAAELMAAQRVSSLVVERPDGWGILTDRDLRMRVLAAGRGGETPVAEVFTYPAEVVPPETLATEVLLLMLDRGFHHFPVVEDGRLLGVVTDTDLMGLERKAPFALKNTIERAPDREAVVAAAGGIPAAVRALLEASVDPVDIGHVVGVTIDALTRRFLELGIAKLGDPPGAWAWLALGSAARHEQALLTDQDHALAYDLGDLALDEVDAYFAELAAFVTQGLADCGIPRCRGGVMAENQEWRHSAEGWRKVFEGFVADLGRTGSRLTGVVFDYRRVTGPLDVEAGLDQVIRRASSNKVFTRHLARIAVELHPPTGFFRDLVVEAKGTNAGTLDVKHGGITPITNLARAYAVSVGLTENRTIARLRGAAAAGRIDAVTRDGLEEAFRLLWQVRLEHHALLADRGEQPDDHVDPRTLGPLSRQGLKEAFRVIRRAQRSLATELGFRTL